MTKKNQSIEPTSVIKLVGKMNKIPTWTKEKVQLKEKIIEKLKTSKHVIFEGNYGYYGISRVGQYYYDSLSKNKQGHMKPLAGYEIILLCIGSGMRAKRTYMATALPIK